MTLGSRPDETLMRALERERRGRRDDYPIRPVWNSMIAGIVFDPKSCQNTARQAVFAPETRPVTQTSRAAAIQMTLFRKCPNCAVSAGSSWLPCDRNDWVAKSQAAVDLGVPGVYG